LWAEGLDKHVYPHILELLETHSFNGHISTDNEKKRIIRRSASNGAGTLLREIRTLVHELEGNDDFVDEDGGSSSTTVSALNTPNRSPLVERHSFVSARRSSSRLTTHTFIDAQEQQHQAE
jgi:hypothetical protein